MCVLCTLALKQKFFPWMAIVYHYALQAKSWLLINEEQRECDFVLKKEEF